MIPDDRDHLPTTGKFLGRRSRSAACFAEPGSAKILLVTSSGGHLIQLQALRQWWEAHERVWVSFDTPDVRSALANERLVTAHHPTTRNVPNLLRNTLLALRVLRRERPDVVISTGAGVAIPFFWWTRLLGISTVYLEVFDRIESPTVTGRLCYPVADAFLVQWDSQLSFYPGAVNVGQVL
jgi:beta-1,4-N-acetylglucosaminyltransferase